MSEVNNIYPAATMTSAKVGSFRQQVTSQFVMTIYWNLDKCASVRICLTGNVVSGTVNVVRGA